MSSNTEEMETLSEANREDTRDNRSGTEEVEPMNEGDDVPSSAGDAQGPVPDYATQKQEVHPLLSQRLKKQDEWYLLDQRWLKQWKKYTGFDSWDQVNAGNESYNPGPVDNSNLFKNIETDTLKDHLMEELDYALIPKPAWEKLSRWYGLTAGSSPICRKVVEYGTYVKHLKVEVYLFELKLCIHPHVNDIKSYRFSRANTIKDVEDTMRELFEIAKEEDVRLWQRYMTNSYELLTNHNQTLADAGIYGGQLIMIEKKNSEGQWQRNSSNYSTASFGASSTGGGSPHVTRSTTSYGSSGYSSYYDRGKEPTTPGLCGLSNLGNTCFMNSALQCLSNTPPLTEYFIGNEKRGEKPYMKHINKDNPLGMGGALAETYGSLLEEMWCGQNSYLAPRQFKLMIGKHAPQFSGFQQHDTHELLAFLLDGLHEDLNLVRKKPYVDMDIKTDGRTDSDIAEETWHKYLLRNQSVIVRVFQGQLKSTLDCPKCRQVSRIFDPFMYLSLPIPITKTRDIFIYLVSKDPMTCVTKYRLSVPKSGSIGDLKDVLNTVTGIDPKSMVVIDVYHSRFHRVYYNKDPLSHIMDRDDIYVYELAYPMEHADWVPVPVYMREIHYHKSYTYYGAKHTTSYGQVFGLPIVVTVPRQGCTYRCVYDTIVSSIQRYVKTRSDASKTTEGDKEGVENEASESENKVDEMEVRTTVEPEPIGDTPGEAEQQNGDQNENEQNELKDNTENGQDESQDNSDNGEHSKEQPMETSEEDEEKKDTSDLFRLSIVNSYGSQEVQKLADEGDKLLKLTSQTYLGCEWDSNDKDTYYNVDASQAVVEDQSCLTMREGKKPISIYDCMDLFVQKEVLGEDDTWYCPHCKEFVQASKKFDLWKMPEILVIHLKRFSYTRWYRNKIEARIEFPLEELDLSSYVTNADEAQPLYDLYAVDNHYGGLGGGHYTAYCKNKNTGKWYSFDDSHVSAVSGDENQICSSSSYLLFYRRRVEGKPVPGILDRSLSVSFEEEVVKGKKKFQREQSSKSLEMDSNKIKEEREEEREDGEGNIDDDSAFESEAV